MENNILYHPITNMIEIDNRIDENSGVKARIYYKDEYVGECLNELAFLKVRVQIHDLRSEDYSFELVYDENGVEHITERYKFNKYGRYPLSVPDNLFWNNYENLLSELL